MAFVPRLLDLLLSLLEALFSTPPRVAPQDNNDDYSSHHHQSPEQRDAALQAALKFFEIKSENLSREVLKKKYRRFSLYHHPDRNNNTEESKQTMQKINNFYKVLNEELDRREGIHHESEEEEEEEVRDESAREEQPETCQGTKAKNRGKQSKSARKRQRRKAKKREKEAQARMDEEIRKEYEEVKRQKREVKREQQREFKQAVQTVLRHGLDTEEGRDKAYREWKEAMENMPEPGSSNNGEAKTPQAENGTIATKKETASGLMDNIDGDHAPELGTEIPEDKQVPMKPVNLIMECCMKDSVIALRLGLTDAVIDEIQNDIERSVEKVVAKAFFRGREEVSKSEVVVAAVKSLTQPLDEDGNTLLHYAVYYESNDTVSVIYHFAVTFEALAEVFLATNYYQMIPLEFSKCCVKDQRLVELMKHFTDSAREDLASKRLLPSLKQSARRLWGIVCNVNVSRLVLSANFLLSCWIGTHLFERSRIISFLLALMPMFSRFLSEEPAEMDDERKAHAATLFAAHLSWRCFCWIFSLVPWIWWCVILLILVFAKRARPKQDYWARILAVPLLIVVGPHFHFLHFLEVSIRLPAFIKSGSQLERTAILLIFTAGYALVRLGVAYYRGDEGDDILLVEEDTLEDAKIFTGDTFESLL